MKTTVAAKKTSAETSVAVRVPKHGGGRLRTGNPGNKGGGRKPLEYIEFLRGTLDSEEHRRVLRALLQSANKQFLGATELANSYVRSKPAQKVGVDAKVTVLWDL